MSCTQIHDVSITVSGSGIVVAGSELGSVGSAPEPPAAGADRKAEEWSGDKRQQIDRHRQDRVSYKRNKIDTDRQVLRDAVHDAQDSLYPCDL